MIASGATSMASSEELTGEGWEEAECQSTLRNLDFFKKTPTLSHTRRLLSFCFMSIEYHIFSLHSRFFGRVGFFCDEYSVCQFIFVKFLSIQQDLDMITVNTSDRTSCTRVAGGVG